MKANEQAIADIQQNIRTLRTLIFEISDQDLRGKSNPEKWSRKEILGHLVDSAVHNLQRFCALNSSAEKYVVQTYAQEALVGVNQYQTMERVDLVQLWQSLNAQICTVLKPVTEKQLEQIVQLPSGKDETYAWLIQDYVIHMNHHLKQILSEAASNPPCAVQWSRAKRLLQEQAPQEFVQLMQYGDLELEYYQPNLEDKQAPHTRDELYIIAQGKANFYREGEVYPVEEKDVLFVRAHEVHRFENFTSDFATWVVFYGAER